MSNWVIGFWLTFGAAWAVNLICDSIHRNAVMVAETIMSATDPNDPRKGSSY
jgi:hypothetical protein